jgi:anti-sigma28 factor (negative regulator of flagellin synthesis)
MNKQKKQQNNNDGNNNKDKNKINNDNSNNNVKKNDHEMIEVKQVHSTDSNKQVKPLQLEIEQGSTNTKKDQSQPCCTLQ